MQRSFLLTIASIAIYGLVKIQHVGADESDADRLTVVFPSNAQLTFVARRQIVGRELAVDETIAEQVPELLRSAANGDVDSADAVAYALQICADAYTTQADLDAAIEFLMRTGRRTSPRPGWRILMIPNEDSRRVFADEMREQFRQCNGVTSEDIATAGRWREMALRYGRILAYLDYAGSLGTTEEGLAAWEKAWTARSGPALHWIGTLYERGVRPLADGTPNYMEAYAYKFLHLKLQQAVTPNPQTQTRHSFLERFQKDLDRTGGYLNPNQWATAVARAQVLMEQANRDCCIMH